MNYNLLNSKYLFTGGTPVDDVINKINNSVKILTNGIPFTINNINNRNLSIDNFTDILTFYLYNLNNLFVNFDNIKLLFNIVNLIYQDILNVIKNDDEQYIFFGSNMMHVIFFIIKLSN